MAATPTAPIATADRALPAQQTQPVVPPIRLTNYLMRHGEYASGLGRQSIHSIVVGQDESPERPDAERWE